MKDDKKDDKKSDKKDNRKELTDIQRVIVSLFLKNDMITIPELARKAGVSESKISREIKKLRSDLEILKRDGGRKNGHWVIKEH